MNNHCGLLAAMLPELAGMEFDWFAVDRDGYLALFATAGEGFIPDSVAAHCAEHMAISDSLETPNSGTPSIWNDYAAYGLYVFDWDLPGGPSYTKQAAPLSIVPQDLRAKIMAVTGVPKFSGSFSAVQELMHW